MNNGKLADICQYGHIKLICWRTPLQKFITYFASKHKIIEKNIKAHNIHVDCVWYICIDKAVLTFQYGIVFEWLSITFYI